MPKIGIILGSTRPTRVGEQVALWVHGVALQHEGATFELVDLREHPLPHLDEPLSPMLGQYQHAHTKAWAETIASYDGFVFVTAEYNNGLPGVLKNALDYLHAEWSNKAAGIVSYGVVGGSGAAAQLRQVCGMLGMADVPRQVALGFHTDFENFSIFTPGPASAVALEATLEQVIAWSDALAPLRLVSA